MGSDLHLPPLTFFVFLKGSREDLSTSSEAKQSLNKLKLEISTEYLLSRHVHVFSTILVQGKSPSSSDDVALPAPHKGRAAETPHAGPSTYLLSAWPPGRYV